MSINSNTPSTWVFNVLLRVELEDWFGLGYKRAAERKSNRRVKTVIS